METLERLAGRLAENCNRLASFEPGMRDREEILEAASAVGGLTDAWLALGDGEPFPAVKPEPASRQPAGEPATALVVEDEATDRASLARMLEVRGYRVLEAGSGSAAMSVAEAHHGPIHVLLTNIILPDVSGRELAERLSLLRPEMGEIYMSGYTDEEVLYFGLLGPEVPFVQKPVRPGDLFEKLARLLEAEYA